MKRLLFLLFTMLTLAGYAQYPITSINITMPANPPANTSDWATAMPPVMITAQAQMRNGQVPGDVQECKILVTIKQGGSKKYGTFTPDNAPSAGFTTAVKNWSGSNATTLLGNSATLPPGTYELCVQFFTYNTLAKPLSNEVCKTFTIADNKPDTKPITNLNITMSSTPPANTADWATSIPPVMITAQTKLNNGQVPGNVQESKILVTIKQGGSKKYGAYTAGTAPASGFNSPVKTWVGANATILLGKDYTLEPGDYELCAQLFWQGPAGIEAISDEKCKPFTIKDTKEQNYTPPVNLTPADKKIFTEDEIKAPITFRWTPLCCRPSNPPDYRLNVWQVGEGKNAAQVMQTEQPGISEMVKGQTQFSYRKGWDGKGNYVWRVEAIDGQGKVLGVSEATGFGVSNGENYTPPVNESPADKKIFTENEIKAPITFRWTPLCCKPRDPVTYKLRVWQLMQGQNGTQAMRTNPPIVTKDVDNITQANIANLNAEPCMWPRLCAFVWNVQAVTKEGKVIGESEATSFDFISLEQNNIKDSTFSIVPISPRENAPAKNTRPPFSWRFDKFEEGITYAITVREFEPGKDPKTGKIIFEKTGLKENLLQYPADVRSLDSAKAYTWSVSAFDKNKTLLATAGPIIIMWPWPLCIAFAWPNVADVCLGSPMQISYFIFGGSGSVTWSLSNGQTGNTNPISISPLPTTPGVYTYTVDITRGACHKQLQVTFNVYPNLSAQVLDYPNGNPVTSLCFGEDATLKMNGLPASCDVTWSYNVNGGPWISLPGGGLGNFYNTNPINWFSCTGNSAIVQFRGIPNPGCLNLPGPWPAGCLSSITSLTVYCPTTAGSIAATSSTHTIQPGNKICSNGIFPVNLSLTLSGNIGSITGWTRSPGSIATSTSSTITDVIAAAGTYTYTASVKNGPATGGCPGSNAQITIIVEDPSSATLTSNKTEVCWGDDAKLTLSNIQPAGSTIQWFYQVNCTGPWTSSGVTGSTQNTNELYGPSYPGVFPPGGAPCSPDKICWKAIITSPTGICTPTTVGPLTINVIVPPTAPAISPLGPLVKCPTASTTLTASTPVCGTAPFTYLWFLNGLPVANGQVIQATNPGNYSVEVTNKNKCATAQSSNTVTIRDCITKVVVSGPCTCTKGMPIMLTANVTSSVDPPGNPGNCGGPYTYQWSTGQTTQSISFQCPSQTTTYWVKVTNAMGCVTQVNHTIKICK